MTLQLKVPDMVCAACAETITKVVMDVDPVAQVKADLKTKMVSVETQQPETVIKEAIANAGYHPT